MGYHGFQFHTDKTVKLEEDLIRRDLTINAMAMDENGNIYDPYGGQNDLNQKFFVMSQMLLLKIHSVFYALQDLLHVIQLTDLRLLKKH